MRCVPTSRTLLLFTLGLLSTCLPLGATAQTELPCEQVEIRVRVMLNDDRPPGERLRVELLASGSYYVDQIYTDEEGNGRFGAVRPGAYALRASGIYVKTTTGPTFTLRCHQGSDLQMLRVPRTEDAEKQVQEARTQEALISALDMRVPDKAKKEFERGEKARLEGRLDEAKKRYESAVGVYPEYARAYNSLGVVLTTLDDPEAGIRAWERAVALNDHYPDALINLAKVRFNHRDLRGAEELLKKALTADPNNLDALGLLVPTQFMNAEYDGVVDSARRLHAVPLHLQYAMVHRIAARALEAQNRPEEALEQYTLFLQETTDARSADEARAEVARLKSRLGR